MALPQVHVICGFAGGDGTKSDKQALLKSPQWSEEPPTATATTNSAVDKDGLRPVFRVTNLVDIYASVGKDPNAGVSPRLLLLAAHAPHDIYVEPGDKFAWVAP